MTTYTKDEIFQIYELAEKTLTNWTFNYEDTFLYQATAKYQDVDEEYYFKIDIIPQTKNIFSVCVEVSVTSCLWCVIARELSGEEELIQYLKKLNTVNGLTMDAIKDELTKSLREYCNQIF